MAAPEAPLGGRPVLGWILGIGLFLALALLLHLTFGWKALLRPWTEIPPSDLALALVLVMASYAVRTVRIHRYFQPDTSGGFLRSFRLILLHNLFNNLLPMRTGEASFPILMKREFRVGYPRSVSGLVYLRVLDLHFLVVLGAAVLLLHHGPWVWIVPPALAPLPFLAFLFQTRLQRGLRPSEGPGRRREAGAAGRLLAKGLSGFPPHAALFWETSAWTAVNWVVKLMVFAWILRAFAPMPYATALLGSITGELSSVLPFHGLAGAGTYEAGILAGLVPLGVGLDAALPGAVNLHLFVLGAAILSGLVAVLMPVGVRTREPAPDS